MFQFTRFPLPVLCVHTGVTLHDECRVAPFGYPRINARSTATRGFSQSPTSFIGSRRLGIHRWLFVAWEKQRCSCSLCNSQGARDGVGPGGSSTKPEVLLEGCGRGAGGSTAVQHERAIKRSLLQNGTENELPVLQLGVPLHGWTFANHWRMWNSLER